MEKLTTKDIFELGIDLDSFYYLVEKSGQISISKLTTNGFAGILSHGNKGTYWTSKYEIKSSLKDDYGYYGVRLFKEGEEDDLVEYVKLTTRQCAEYKMNEIAQLNDRITKLTNEMEKYTTLSESFSKKDIKESIINERKQYNPESFNYDKRAGLFKDIKDINI